MKNLFFAAVLAGLLSSCAVNPSEVTPRYANEFIGKAIYVKDARTGFCFAIIGTRKSFETNENGVSFTWVPCKEAEPFLVK